MSFKRLHKPPKKVIKEKRRLGELSPKAKYLCKQSLQRYLKAPGNKKFYDSSTQALRGGEIGFIEGISIHFS